MKIVASSDLTSEKLIEKLEENGIDFDDLCKFYNKKIITSIFGEVERLNPDDDEDYIFYFKMYNVYLKNLGGIVEDWYEVKPIRIAKTVYIEEEHIEKEIKSYISEGYTKID